ncbi:DUF664 domain-containing protein [Leptobacterium flavescens]|uniref:DUF664 domain-containing protein n=1 Tax=Leptobacterium flavescens TaxID=472055 RepID=A0A6P0UKN5_9FLAO|nr:DinB family protein [Leptobacterium flavescens]NER13784.1 DUF664 domain-containing protein [Leptobacterium flavescens]
MKRTELKADEYHPYYSPYMEILGDAELMEALSSSATELEELIIDLPREKMSYSYAEGKWTVAEILLHLIDAERVFQYRALRFARKDMTDLPGFEQDDYVKYSNAEKRTKKDILEEFKAVRSSSLNLFGSFSEDTLLQKGTANQSYMSVRALGFVLSGHVRHHMKIIRERYLD